MHEKIIICLFSLALALPVLAAPFAKELDLSGAPVSAAAIKAEIEASAAGIAASNLQKMYADAKVRVEYNGMLLGMAKEA